MNIQHNFVPGQRWSSDSESELGLGVVLSLDGRTVEITFPATGETRRYAVKGAPLTRVVFEAGDTVKEREGRVMTVLDSEVVGDLITYRCEDEGGQVCRLSELQLDDHLRRNRPQERLLGGRIDRDAWFSLRYESWQRGAEQLRSPAFGLLGARVSPVPHQLYIASQVAGRFAPRVLLADEVGLGKTIEAGLIMHRLLLAERVKRVLVVVPEALLHQWLVEMLRRFNLRFALFDRGRFEQAEGSNPFLAEQRVLCSLEFLLSDPQVARDALTGEWELLVVDEAHHLHWSPEQSSLEYDFVAALAAEIPGVLLLTATPEQLGRAGHFARLRLLDPHRFPDYDAFLAEEEGYAPVAALAARLLEGEPLDTAQRALLHSLLGDGAEDEPQAVIDRLVDRHGTGRVLYRNTRSAIKGFPARQPHAYPLPLPADYRALEGEGAALLTPELPYGPGWERVDPRVGWLTAKLRELRPEKVLVICAHATTAEELREALHRGEGIHAALFHEGLEIVERDRAAAYFADEEGSQVLICSEIGSEGRNFQFAHHLVLFDLPLEPELLEQRIGRLDRIGQRETIRLHVPYLEGSPSEVLYRWYAEGLGAFAAVSPAAGAVQETLGEALHAALAAPADAARREALIAEAAALTARLNGELEQGRDRLLELHSHRPEASGALVKALLDHDRDEGLRGYMSRYWDNYGVEHDHGPGLSEVLHPGAHMLHHNFPALPEDGATVTFDRADALAHEDREFLTWEHPMVRGAMELLTGDDLGSTALTLIRDARFKPGTPLLELVYVAECPAPPELEMGRFLPPTPHRLLLDPKGRDLAARVPHETLQGESLTNNRELAAAVIKSQSTLLRRLLKHADELVQGTAQGLRTAAEAEMHRALGEELERLRALAALEAGVRQEEVTYLETRMGLLAHHLERTRMRLDAARLVVAH